MKLRYSEAFYSVQGEGKFVGVPSVFLRTFGCNFRCMNFGTDEKRNRTELHADGIRYNAEVKDLIDAKVHETTEKFEDLPIIHTGCDTYASIYPEFKHFNKQATVDEVVEHLLSLTPNGKWVQDNGQDVHLIMTGGEPLLAWQRLYVELFEHPRMQDLRNITFETNTTQHLHDDLYNYLNDSDRLTVTWSCSQNLVSQENLGKLLSSLMLLVSILGLTVANFILSLLWLLKTTLQKLKELWTLTEVPGWNVRYILCQWAVAVKNTPSMLKTWLKRVWQKDGDLPPDSISAYSEMPGELRKYKNAQHEKAMKAPIDQDALRKAGL